MSRNCVGTQFESSHVEWDELEAAHEARLDAELELLEAKSEKAKLLKAARSGDIKT
jgi:hypothetical protein